MYGLWRGLGPRAQPVRTPDLRYSRGEPAERAAPASTPVLLRYRDLCEDNSAPRETSFPGPGVRTRQSVCADDSIRLLPVAVAGQAPGDRPAGDRESRRNGVEAATVRAAFPAPAVPPPAHPPRGQRNTASASRAVAEIRIRRMPAQAADGAGRHGPGGSS